MGLSSFPSSSEGLLPLLMVSTVLVITILKKAARTLRGGSVEEEPVPLEVITNGDQSRRVSVTRFKSLCRRRNSSGGNKPVVERIATECCVCLCRFEAEEEVSELVSCKHFFHKGCLHKWFDNRRNSTSSCPLCRSLL